MGLLAPDHLRQDYLFTIWAPAASPPYTDLWLDGFLRGFSRCSSFYSISLAESLSELTGLKE